jgi:hypothetical protein
MGAPRRLVSDLDRWLRLNESNLGELMQSPYGDDGRDEPKEVPWKLPVGAAIVGALIMATLVILSIVNAPTAETESVAAFDVPADTEPIRAVGFPQGYEPTTDDVAMRGDVMSTDSEGTTVFVSSVVTSGSDADGVSAVDVASWTVHTSRNEPVMLHQSSTRLALGAVTVEFSPVAVPDDATLIATLPGTIVSATDVLMLPREVPTTISNHRIEAENGVVVIDELSIGNGFGSMQWHLEGGIAAKVDVAVTFDGLEFPLSLVTPHAAPEGLVPGIGTLPPLWNHSGETRMLRDGEPLSGTNAPTGITVEFSVSVVSDAGDEIEIPIGTAAQE